LPPFFVCIVRGLACIAFDDLEPHRSNLCGAPSCFDRLDGEETVSN
jgi:hypothetical protein